VFCSACCNIVFDFDFVVMKFEFVCLHILYGVVAVYVVARVAVRVVVCVEVCVVLSGN